MKFEVEIKNEDAILKQVIADKREDGIICHIEDITDEDICNTIETSVGCFMSYEIAPKDIYIKRIS